MNHLLSIQQGVVGLWTLGVRDIGLVCETVLSFEGKLLASDKSTGPRFEADTSQRGRTITNPSRWIDLRLPVSRRRACNHATASNLIMPRGATQLGQPKPLIAISLYKVRRSRRTKPDIRRCLKGRGHKPPESDVGPGDSGILQPWWLGRSLCFSKCPDAYER